MNISKYVGIPWNPVGRDVESGLDCWGLVRLFYQQEMGISLPSYSNISAEETGKEDCSVVIMNSETYKQFDRVGGEPELGDILIFNMLGTPIHVAIALDNATMLHAHKSAQGVVVEQFKSSTWNRRLEGIYRWKQK